jgi:glycosyltransferase involved in cell wall biosynthesis
LSRELAFVVPGPLDQPTGGYLYDARICGELRKRGWTIRVMELPGRFPLADRLARDSLSMALASLAPGAAVVIDGLALGGLPEVVRPHAQRLQITALVHHPLADETGLPEASRQLLHRLETEALAAAARIIVTSRHTADRLRALSMALAVVTVEVVPPGTFPAALAAPIKARLEGREPAAESLLCVASLVPRKGHLFLVEALARLRSHQWHCVFAGPLDRAPDHAAQIAAQVGRKGLANRVRLTGTLSAKRLERAYHEASLLVLPSLYEGYGMVISEALARGLPSVTTTAGALQFTAPDDASLKVPPADAGALFASLRDWLEDLPLRRRYTASAAAHRLSLRSWQDAGDDFIRALAN